jgi:hypothetical protein
MKIHTRIAITISILLIFSGCSHKPDEETIQSGLQNYVEKTTIDLTGMGHVMPNLAQYGGPKNKLVDYRITNKYTKKVDGENYYIYDFEADIRHYAGEGTIQGSIGFVKRGESWYSIRID